ncbi:hypothetical protein EPN95_04030 [Patescibacteria group bacterium]|nr:MAG: hypothetical protein EPN95_04030 [Patescibacteria group bacterium]
MNVVFVFAGLAVVLFVSAFITRRRFGLLGLALAAGSILSGIWSFDAGLVVGTIGVIPPGPLTTSITLGLIVLLPAIVLLFHGYTYKSLLGRIVGALLFTLLALAFLVTPLGFGLPLSGIGANIYAQLVKYKEVIISIGLVIAVIDLFFTKPAAPLLDRKSKR